MSHHRSRHRGRPRAQARAEARHAARVDRRAGVPAILPAQTAAYPGGRTGYARAWAEAAATARHPITLSLSVNAMIAYDHLVQVGQVLPRPASSRVAAMIRMTDADTTLDESPSWVVLAVERGRSHMLFHLLCQTLHGDRTGIDAGLLHPAFVAVAIGAAEGIVETRRGGPGGCPCVPCITDALGEIWADVVVAQGVEPSEDPTLDVDLDGDADDDRAVLAGVDPDDLVSLTA